MRSLKEFNRRKIGIGPMSSEAIEDTEVEFQKITKKPPILNNLFHFLQIQLVKML